VSIYTKRLFLIKVYEKIAIIRRATTINRLLWFTFVFVRFFI